MGALKDKVVVVTGGADGIGKACVTAYAAAGATVAILDVNVDGATVLADSLPDAIGLLCDVGDGAQVERAIAAVHLALGRIDAIHNNAGISSPSLPLHQTSADEWDALLRTNLTSVFNTTRAAYEDLRATRGSILNTASMVGLIGQENHAAYVATKGGMIALTKAMALDYAADGIRVNAICPAGVETPLLQGWIEQQPDPTATRAYLDHLHPLGPTPAGDVIADAAVFLLSDAARFITGCALPVSGGAELGYRR
jgi:NAD(P)-dependent dehydrogenase (short-subunit alcohol dehydrogenase family)